MEGKPLAYIKILSVGGGSGSEDSCLNYTVSELNQFHSSPSESVILKNPKCSYQTRGTLMTIADSGFMGIILTKHV
jgi:hypothetical protein